MLHQHAGTSPTLRPYPGPTNSLTPHKNDQTGNTVFAALGVSDLPVSAPRIAWTKSLASILSFLLGSVLLTALHRRLGATKRWVLCISFLLQALMIAVSAVLVKLGHSSGSPVGGGGSMIIISDTVSSGGIAIPRDPGFPWTDLLPIAFLSFQAAGKVVASRMTSQTGLPVVVLTTLYNDLISDPALFTAGLSGNIPRNRKVGGLIMYFGGATVGGVAASSQLGFSGGLGIGCAIQVGIAIAWSVWFEEIKSDSDEQ